MNLVFPTLGPTDRQTLLEHLGGIIESDSIEAITALLLSAIIHRYRNEAGLIWHKLSLAVSLATTLGLNRLASHRAPYRRVGRRLYSIEPKDSSQVLEPFVYVVHVCEGSFLWDCILYHIKAIAEQIIPDISIGNINSFREESW